MENLVQELQKRLSSAIVDFSAKESFAYLEDVAMGSEDAMEEVLEQGSWMHFFPEGSMWFYYPDIRPLKKAVFKYAVEFDRPVLPCTFSFRPRQGLWKLIGNKPLVQLNIGDPVYHDKSLSKLEATRKLQQDVYHIMQEMNGIHPGDPTYNTNLDLANYQKTM